MVKYNSAGEIQWIRQLGTTEYDTAYGVAIDTSDNIYVAGYTKGALTGTNFGGADFFIVKYNPAGEKQWTRQLGTDDTDQAFSVAIDTNGNIYVAGCTKGALAGTNFGGYDLFVVKYNSAGEIQWIRQLGTIDDEEIHGVATDTSGNIYGVGSTERGLDGNTHVGLDDLFVVKYNSTGEKQWTKQLGTFFNEVAFDVATDTSDNIYMTLSIPVVPNCLVHCFTPAVLYFTTKGSTTPMLVLPSRPPSV